MKRFQKNKFNFREFTMNSDGKQSGSGFIGVVIGLIGCLGFIASIIGYFLKIPETIPFMQQTTLFIGASTLLLGTRKIFGKDIPIPEEEIDESEKG